nr:hypothetical protein [Tanacetum cinerariifolium]
MESETKTGKSNVHNYQSSIKDKILATSIDTSKVENAPAEMLHDLDQQMEKRVDDGKANVVTDVLSRKERVKSRHVQAMAPFSMESTYGKERRQDFVFYGAYLVSLVESEMDEAHASRYLEWNSGDDQTQSEMDDLPRDLANTRESVRDAIGFEYCLASSSRYTK